MKITNTTRDQTLNFVTTGKVKDGVASTESVAPGETKDIDLHDAELARLAGEVIAGRVNVPKATADKIEHTYAAPSDPKAK